MTWKFTRYLTLRWPKQLKKDANLNILNLDNEWAFPRIFKLEDIKNSIIESFRNKLCSPFHSTGFSSHIRYFQFTGFSVESNLSAPTPLLRGSFLSQFWVLVRGQILPWPNAYSLQPFLPSWSKFWFFSPALSGISSLVVSFPAIDSSHSSLWPMRPYGFGS